LAEADPNAATRTAALPADGAAEITGSDEDSRQDDRRLPAPLQFRDSRRYAILGEHGRGGLGRVLRAHDKELGRAVAIKELLKRSDPSELRFFREAMITARLEHPGIVPVHEAGRWTDGTPFYAMKLVSGKPLNEVISSRPTLPTRLELLPHVVAVADAISYAHACGVIHRDLKPSNVMLGNFGETIVIDWGLAKQVGESEPSSAGGSVTEPPPTGYDITGDGAILGTPAFMAPEQRAGHASAASDIYAIGGMLLSIVIGSSPSPEQLLRLDDTLRRSNAPRDLAAIIERAMQPTPELRYAQASDLGNDVKRFIARLEVSARTYSVVAKATLFFARNGGLAAATLVFLVIVVSILAAATIRVKGEADRARAAEAVAEESRGQAKVRLSEVTLAHAQTLLLTDPSEAFDVLNSYRGTNSQQAEFLRSAALAQGVATWNFQPHNDTVLFMSEGARGSFISQGEDGLFMISRPGVGVAALAADVDAHVTPVATTDGEWIVFWTLAHSLVAMNTSNGARIVLDTEDRVPAELFLASDGRTLVVRTRDGHIIVWEHDGGFARRFTVAMTDAIGAVAHQGAVYALTDSHLVALGPHGEPTRSVQSVRKAMMGSMSSDGVLALGLDDGALLTIDLSTMHPTLHGRICPRGFRQLAMQSSHAVAACRDRNVVVAGPSGAPRTALALDSEALSVAIAADGGLAIVGTIGGNVYVVNTTSGAHRALLGHRAPVTGLLGLSNGGVVSADAKGNVRVWQTPFPADLSVVDDAGALAMVFLGRDLLVRGTSDGNIVFWNVSTGHCSASQVHKDRVWYVRRSPHDHAVVSLGFDGAVAAWNDAAVLIGVKRPSGPRFVDLDFESDDVVILADERGLLTRWNFRSGATSVVAQLPSQPTRIRVSTRLRRVVSSLLDGSVIVSDLDGQVLRALPAGTADAVLTAVADGNVVGLGNARGEVRILFQDTLIHVATFEAAVRYVAVSRDERLLVAASEKGEVALLKLSPVLEPVFSLVTPFVQYASFTSDSRVLGIADSEGTAHLFDIESRRWRTLKLFDSPVRAWALAAEYMSASGGPGLLATAPISQRSAPATTPCMEMRNE
jgi:WD40 repeat protein